MATGPIPTLPGDHTAEQYADFLVAMMKLVEKPDTLSLLIVRDSKGNYFARGSADIEQRAAMLQATVEEMDRRIKAAKDRN